MKIVVAEYDYYTLDQARRIIAEENRHRERKRTRRKALAIYYIKQKLSGLLLVAIGTVIPVVANDITFSIFMIPLGIYLMLTKEKVMMF